MIPQNLRVCQDCMLAILQEAEIAEHPTLQFGHGSSEDLEILTTAPPDGGKITRRMLMNDVRADCHVDRIGNA